MISPDALAALRAELGSDAVEEHPAIEVDGVPISVTLRPRDVPALSDAIASLSGKRLAAVIRGGGTRLGVGNPPRPSDVILSTERLHGIDVFEPDEGVCHVLAGTPVRELRAHVNAEGWEVPIDPPGAATTVGGTVAAAAIGPRAQAFGPTRDAVLGLEVALASGERTRCGGRVVKNVTGYDMNKLYTGSFGTLGVIASAWLRLRPLPRSVRSFEAHPKTPVAACSGALAAARLTTARATALLAPAGDTAPLRIVVELAGDGPAVEQDSAWLAAELSAAEAAPEAIERVRDHQGGLGNAGGLRFRIAVLPSRQKTLMAALRAAGATTLCYPGLRLVYAGFELPADAPAATAEAVFEAVSRAAAGVAGCVLCEAAPAAAKSGRDMHGDATPWIPLFEALKHRFDPSGVLNPGRFAGGL